MIFRLFKAEDAVCLADYCDIMRCDVLINQDQKTVYSESGNTDIELWREASTTYSKALAPTGPRDVAKYSVRKIAYQKNSSPSKESAHCQKSEAPSDNNGNII